MIVRVSQTALSFLILFAACWLAGYIAFVVDIMAVKSKGGSAQADAIVVLTGGPDRVNTGLDLLAAGAAENLFISGVATNVTVEKLISLWRHDTQAPCCITLGHRARNTQENASETRSWVLEKGLSSISLVTADYHLPRALLEFGSVLPDLDIRPYPVSSGRFRLAMMFSEYNKTLYAWLRMKAK